MSQYVFGVDIGGTTVKLGLFDQEGNVLDKWEIPTRTQDHGSSILPDIAKSIQDKMTEKSIHKQDVTGVGVGAPGPVDSKGTIYKAVNLGWGVFSIKDTLEEILKIPVMAGNDANVAALGEMWKGGGRGFDSIVMVTLGTGVGGGVILGGKILTGTKGAAGEIGHMTVEYDEEETCNCGTKGCLEQYASATGIVRLAKKQMVETSSLAKIDNLTAKDVFDEAKAGDAYALQIVDQFAHYLGVALGNVAQIIDPEAFVIGGGVARAGSIITESIEKYYNDSVMFALRGKQFNLAELGNDAGIYGAVRMVL